MRPRGRLATLALWLALALPANAQVADLAALQAQAEAGDPGAQFRLGELYRQGVGLPQNYARAAQWYGAAAEQGHGPSLNALAGLHARGLGVEPDPARAFELLTEAAETGQPEHLYHLGLAHESGLGTEADPARAAELYEQAIAGGWLPAAVALAVLYQEGQGVPQDVARALELYNGPAEAGNAQAQNNIGLLYVRGSDGIDQDYAKAAEWLTRAAEQGLPEALRNLGVMYQNGFGVEADEEQAARLYRLAALAPGAAADAQGDAARQPLLFDSRLTPPDPAQAASYALAAQAGDPVGMFLLAFLQAQAAEGAADHRVVARLFQQAAARGMPAAMANLGILMFDGRGVLQDYVEGYKWLTLATVSGLPGAAEVRDVLAGRMTSAQVNAANDLAEAAWSDGTVARLPAP